MPFNNQAELVEMLTAELERNHREHFAPVGKIIVVMRQRAAVQR